MTQPQALYQLQEIDLSLARISKRSGEINVAIANNHVIHEAQERVVIAQKALSPLQTKVRNLELEIQTNNEKIQQTDSQLYGGKVRNPKQLQEMEQEIQSLGRRNAELENILLDTMLNMEAAESDLQRSQAQLAAVTQQWETDHAQLLDELKALKSEYKQLQEKRQQALLPITTESLKVYDTLRPRKNNQPLALLKAGSCSACRVEQEMSVIAEARKGQKLTTCSSCGRILVYKDG
jgi:hypothetical protein